MHLKSSKLTIPTPCNFNFSRTAFSHGWYALPPFSFDQDKKQLHRVLSLSDGTIVVSTLTGGDHSVLIRVRGAQSLLGSQRKEIASQLRTCLRLDEDFGEFHREARRHPEFRWIPRTGSGRMLRAPTVFEDVVKMICTTNCTWALTTLMVTNLVQQFGEKLDSSLYAFPTPEAIAGS
ncbi:MAG: 3-methyladenine DNA glycosylase, partial [Bacteroidota bacterium]